MKQLSVKFDNFGTICVIQKAQLYYYENKGHKLRFVSYNFVVKMKDDFNMKVLYCLILSSLAITQLKFMLMCFVINQRHRQIEQNKQFIWCIMMKKSVHKAAGRSCWVRKGRTSVWWGKVLTNKIPESEWSFMIY